MACAGCQSVRVDLKAALRHRDYMRAGKAIGKAAKLVSSKVVPPRVTRAFRKR